MSDRDRLFENLMREEAAMWPGATIWFGTASKHRFAEVGFGGKTRKTFFPCTSGDHRGAMNAVKGVRHALIDIGAVRQAPAKAEHTERKHRPRSQHGAAAPRPGELVARPDTWLGPLAAIRQRMESA